MTSVAVTSRSMKNFPSLRIELGVLAALGLPAMAFAGTVRFDFETGDLQGWQIVEGKLAAPVCSRATYHNTALGPTCNKEGKYFISTLEAADGSMDSTQTAVIKSPVFVLEGPAISFLIGGGKEQNAYVALCSEDGTEVFQARGDEHEEMQRITWDASAHVGNKVFLTIVDKETAGWAHVTFDDFTATGRIDPQATEALRASDSQRQQKKAELAQAAKDRLDADRAKRLTELMTDERLFARGERRVYEGDHLGAISMPIGGIAAGPIQINGQARRHIWQIFKNYKAIDLPHSFFAVRAKAAGQPAVVRAIQTAKEGPFEAMQSLKFSGEYPFGWFTFEDPALPVAVSMECFSPLIPLDEKDSAIPCAIFNLTAENKGKEPVEVSFLGTQQNAVGADWKQAISGRSSPAYGGNVNQVLRDAGATFLHLTTSKPKDAANYGDMALAVLNENASATASWESHESLSASFGESGTVSGGVHSGPSPAGQTVDGALAVPFTLAPGEKRTVTFVLAWHFPNVALPEGHVGNMYANWWPDAAAVARDVSKRLDDLSARTHLYNETLYSSNLPYWLLDRISSQVAILSAMTCNWAKNGFFYAWEGCKREDGSCEGNATHVWGYAQAHARLFPAIGRAMREEDAANLRPEGMLPVRFIHPFPAFDGQCAFVMSSYREHLISKDGKWLKGHWPAVKRAMDYMIARWDSPSASIVEFKNNGVPDGMLTGPQHAMDGDQGGTCSWLGSMYLGALSAAAEMADLQGDSASAGRYREILAAGKANQDKALFNGEYYIQVPDPTPQEDYRNGCYIDQMLGQWWALQINCGWIYPQDHVRSAMAALFKHNFRANFHGIPQIPRKFVDEPDAGMQQCTWPQGDRLTSEMVAGHRKNELDYADEVMSGFEYAAAAMMIQSGLLQEPFTVLRAAADRYDGRLRTNLTNMDVASWGYSGNPFGDDEAGKFYARAMAIWSTLLAAQGFIYDGPAGLIGFKPVWKPEEHKSFFTAAEGWGVFVQSRKDGIQTERLELKHGQLELRELVFEVPAAKTDAKATVKADGRPLAAKTSVHGTELRLNLDQAVELKAGETLLVEIR